MLYHSYYSNSDRFGPSKQNFVFNWFRGPLRPLLKLVFNLFRSVLFMTSFIQVNAIGQYYPGPLLGYLKRAILLSAVTPISIALEQAHRRSDITYFVMPRSFEALWNMLKNRKIVRADYPLMNCLILAFSFAVIAYKFSEEENTRQS